MACVSSLAIVSNSLISAARSRVSARKTARLISATSAFSTASTSVSCVFAAWSWSSFAVSSLPKGAILLKFISKSCVISSASCRSGAGASRRRPPPRRSRAARTPSRAQLWILEVCCRRVAWFLWALGIAKILESKLNEGMLLSMTLHCSCSASAPGTCWSSARRWASSRHMMASATKPLHSSWLGTPLHSTGMAAFTCCLKAVLAITCCFSPSTVGAP
mmetsp:Transcript_53753/g.129484  ORF Transcript_53753/g.129484 Transcript_53753/m.129484 type:complete len:219 (+) Transcript_53753:236-892(+)